MTVQTSNTVTFTVAAAPTTVLGTTKAAMVAAGEYWRIMDTTPTDLSVLRQGGNSGHVLPFANEGSWNPISQKIEFVAQDHQAGGGRHFQYDEATNDFVDLGLAEPADSISHCYDHNAINPANGDLYYKRYATGPLQRKTIAGSWDQSFQTVPDNTALQVAMGTCWWSGSLTGAGAQGAFLLFDCSTVEGPRVVGFNPLTDTWPIAVSGFGSGWTDTYHSVMSYSAARNLAVFGGGNADSTRTFRLNADATVTELTDCPIGFGCNGNILTCDPVSGDFLVVSETQVYSLDPTGGGTWTLQGAAHNTPSALEIVSGCIAVPIADHGVVAFISTTSSASTMYLYRHT